jgi:hypothetical protein
MGSTPPPTPSPSWSSIDDWIATGHEPAEEGPAAALYYAELEALLDDIEPQADRITASGLRKHIPDLLLALLAVAFVLSAIVQQFRYAPVSQLTIKAAGGLSAFHVITDADVVAQKLAPQNGSIISVSAARGRYLLQYISKGSPLRESQLSRTGGWDTKLRGLSVIDLPVRLGPSLPSVETNVTLVVSQSNGAPRGAVNIKDVLLLAIRRTNAGTWATVALSEDQLACVNPLLKDSHIFLARSNH